LDRFQGPFFRRGEGRVDEGFTQIDLAAVPEVLGEALQQPIEAARALPELEATMASLVRRIARWQVVPRRARAQDPQDAVHDGPRIGPRPAAPIRATARAEGRFSTAHWTSVRSMPSSTTAILPMFPVDAARLSGQLFSEVRAAERPCAKHQQ
jgi:hypothetical protein